LLARTEGRRALFRPAVQSLGWRYRAPLFPADFAAPGFRYQLFAPRGGLHRDRRGRGVAACRGGQAL